MKKFSGDTEIQLWLRERLLADVGDAEDQSNNSEIDAKQYRSHGLKYVTDRFLVFVLKVDNLYNAEAQTPPNLPDTQAVLQADPHLLAELASLSDKELSSTKLKGIHRRIWAL